MMPRWPRSTRSPTRDPTSTTRAPRAGRGVAAGDGEIGRQRRGRRDGGAALCLAWRPARSCVCGCGSPNCARSPARGGRLFATLARRQDGFPEQAAEIDRRLQEAFAAVPRDPSLDKMAPDRVDRAIGRKRRADGRWPGRRAVARAAGAKADGARSAEAGRSAADEVDAGGAVWPRAGRNSARPWPACACGRVMPMAPSSRSANPIPTTWPMRFASNGP